MARPGSDKVRIKTVRNRTKNGTVYVYERKVRYNPENGYDLKVSIRSPDKAGDLFRI